MFVGAFAGLAAGTFLGNNGDASRRHLPEYQVQPGKFGAKFAVRKLTLYYINISIDRHQS